MGGWETVEQMPFGDYAEVAQLVERNLAKVEVAGSSLVFRSEKIPSAVG